jgi:hypothetical protein
VVGDAMAARLDEGRRRGGRELMQKRYIGKASGRLVAKRKLFTSPLAETLHWESIGQCGKQKGSSSQATPANRL